MKKPVKITLIVVGVIVGLALIGGIVAYLTTGSERKLASEFVDNAAKGDTSAAYGQFSSALKEVQDQETFESQIASLSLDDSCKLSVASVGSAASTSAGNLKEVKGSIKCNDKSFENVSFRYNSDSQLVGYAIN